MLKDPTEFRLRFAAWKEGELPYEAGLPKYADGKGEIVTDYPIPFIKDKVVKLTDAGLATGAVLSTNLLDSIADNAYRAGLDLLTALGLATKESTLGNPTDDRSMRTLLSALRQKELTDHLLEVFGLSYDLLFGLHINRGDIVRGQELINWYKDENNIEHKPSPPLYTTHPDRKSVIQKAFEFYKQHPDKYNPGQKNYQRLVDKRGAEVMGSPEVLKWLKERNIKKAIGNFNRVNPLLKESKFNPRKFKDGKLPKYGYGTPEDEIEEIIKKQLEQRSDATAVQRQKPVLPIKRNFIAEAQRKHAAEAVGPDMRSSYQRKQSLAAKLYANQQYQKAKDDAKRAEGLEQMMKTVSPSTYIEATTGLDLGTVGRFVTDAAVFGLPGVLKHGISKVLSTPILGKWVYNIPEDANMAYRIMGPLERDWLMLGNELSTRATNIATEAEAAAARTKGRINLFKAGAEHGGRKQFAKGQPWHANTTTHGEKQILAIPGEDLPWVSGKHYRGPQGNGWGAGEISFDEAPFGSHIDLLTDETGFSGINPSQLSGSVIYSPFHMFGKKLGYRMLYPKNTSTVGQNLSEINPFKYNSSDFDTKDMFTKMRSFLIRQALSLTVSREKDLVNDPYGIRNLSSDVVHYEGMPAGVEDIFRYLILPRTNINPLEYDRTILLLSRYGYNVLDDYNWAKYVDDNLAGYLDNSTYGIALRDKYINYAGAHEFRHRMQRLIKDKPSLSIDRKSYLDRAYDDDFINLPKNVPEDDSLYGYTLMEDEKATTNLDARKWAFENLTDNPNIRKASVKEQNEFLDNLTDDQIIDAVKESNSYGKKYIKFLDDRYHIYNDLKMRAKYAHRFRNAMKYYGAASVPMTISYKEYAE